MCREISKQAMSTIPSSEDDDNSSVVVLSNRDDQTVMPPLSAGRRSSLTKIVHSSYLPSGKIGNDRYKTERQRSRLRKLIVCVFFAVSTSLQFYMTEQRYMFGTEYQVEDLWEVLQQEENGTRRQTTVVQATEENQDLHLQTKTEPKNRSRGIPVSSDPGLSTLDDNSCAILFFGLPRSYRLFVLPSITENILIPNKKNKCDYYLHYHTVSFEGTNRMGEAGGDIQGSDVFLLETAIRDLYRNESSRIPHISITNSTTEEFEAARGKVMHMYETTLDDENNTVYFPYESPSWEFPQTLRNMIKQWDSIDAVWQHMEKNAKRLGKKYTRVAMVRNDVMYVTPLDVYGLPGNKRDHENKHIVIPDWANYPVNDRMVVGPYDAVEIWATKRFELAKKHVQNYPEKGWGLHSERFLNYTILPSMLNTNPSGYVLKPNPDVCFLRARSDGSVWLQDCDSEDVWPSVLRIMKKYHPSTDDVIECKRKSIKGIKYQDVLSCRKI